MAAGPASYGMTDTMGRMHGDAQFAGSSSVPAHALMMGLIGAGNNPQVQMTVACAVAIEEASNHYMYTVRDLEEKLLNLKYCEEFFKI